MRRMGGYATTWKLAGPVAALGLLTAVAGGCGGDDGTCDYLFADVPTQEDCGAGRVTPENPATGLQAEFDCGNAVYTPSTEGCQLISCQVCADVDADFDGDVDDDL